MKLQITIHGSDKLFAEVTTVSGEARPRSRMCGQLHLLHAGHTLSNDA